MLSMMLVLSLLLWLDETAVDPLMFDTESDGDSDASTEAETETEGDTEWPKSGSIGYPFSFSFSFLFFFFLLIVVLFSVLRISGESLRLVFAHSHLSSKISNVKSGNLII